MTPVTPKPAASVVLVRPAPPETPEPIEVYMIRRNAGMRFLGGYYAFPGGKVDTADGASASLTRCRGLSPRQAERLLAGEDGVPALGYWVAAVRELLEETGLLLACDDTGRPLDTGNPGVSAAIDRCRTELMAGAPFAALLSREGWHADLGALRYLSHFITPASSPIRFSARFFLCPLPDRQAPRLFTEETSEGFWISPGAGYRRFRSGELPMAEPAEYALRYLAQFESLHTALAVHADGHPKFHGIIHWPVAP
jgi:8-oxo-dGTP pyrophosphatase MutT (NUDIX family)